MNARMNGVMPAAAPPLIVHVIHHLVIGGLENGLVNLINHLPEDRYRHAIVCMADYSDFAQRIRRPDVPLFALNKRPGRDLRIYRELYDLFRRLRPQLVHTRNLTALDSLLPAALAGVPCRVHGEHGRDVTDPHGTSAKYRWLRRLHTPLIDHYVTVSKDLEQYLVDAVRVPKARITQIYNGVDTDMFRPACGARERFECFGDPRYFVVGTVGRMQPVKDQFTLVHAMIRLWQSSAEARRYARLVLVGDGALRSAVEALLDSAGLRACAWFAGSRNDVPRLMRGIDLFVLPSLAEGISNTILEAMASGLPVIATAVGGNPELVVDGCTGTLVPAANPDAMAAAIARYFGDRETLIAHAGAGRARVESKFSLAVMVRTYTELYDRMLQRQRHRNTRRSEAAARDCGAEQAALVVNRDRH